MPIGIQRPKEYLDGRECFDMWIETGSLARTVTRMIANGLRNPRNGNSPSRDGVGAAAWRFALTNLDYARAKTAQAWAVYGQVLSDEEWNDLILHAAKSNYTRTKFNRFLVTHPALKEWYEKSNAPIA